jgi:hypothetical protein
MLNATSGTASKLAEALANPGLALTWLLATIGAPATLTGFLVPVRQAGSLLPQLAIAGKIRSAPRRKWYWAGGGFVQALSLILMLAAAGFLEGVAGGIAIVGLLAVFSIASGFGSVAFSDVVGKTIPKGRRGALLSARATSGGLLALAAGLLMRAYLSNEASVTPYLLLLGAAGALWIVASTLFALIGEEPGAITGGRNALAELRAGLDHVRGDADFARFIIVRCLMLPIELAMPFYALLARELVGGDVGNLGVFVIATALAEVLSSPVWGRSADKSSRRVLVIAGMLAVATGAYALALDLLPTSWVLTPVVALIFLGIGFAQAGVRLGRKTYLIDMAPKDERPLYAALSNTVVGVLALASSALGLVAEAFGVRVVIIILVALPLLGALVSWRLNEQEDRSHIEPS